MNFFDDLPELTPEQEVLATQARRHGADDNKTRLSYWFPRVRDAGLPVPRTEIVTATDEEIDAIWATFDGDPAPAFDQLVSKVQTAAEAIWTPCFLRTDFTSSKHSWKDSCYLANATRAAVGGHILRLAEDSAMADVMGLPFDVWAVRELLKTEPLFTAFWGEMPIVREFRFFVRDGTVVHHQPYWPPDSIADHQPSRRDWRRLLDAGSRFRGAEYTDLRQLAERAGAACGGFWSVDLLETTDRGWVLTDMAEGEKSFIWGAVL